MGPAGPGDDGGVARDVLRPPKLCSAATKHSGRSGGDRGHLSFRWPVGRRLRGADSSPDQAWTVLLRGGIWRGGRLSRLAAAASMAWSGR